MKHIFLLAVAIFLGLINCWGQNKEKDTVMINQPNTDIKVNKEYDDNGNLIRYDSTYSYSYSSDGTDSLMSDSVMNIFKEHFNKQFLSSDDPFMKDFFFPDSISKDDFFDDDFFTKRFREHIEQMDRLFYEMDSVKNEYFKKQDNRNGERSQYQSL